MKLLVVVETTGESFPLDLGGDMRVEDASALLEAEVGRHHLPYNEALPSVRLTLNVTRPAFPLRIKFCNVMENS